MSGWRDEYTAMEWSQIAIFLVGLPLAALVGALVGLVGKWKQGSIANAAVAGLGGAAFVSVMLFLLFLAFPLLSGDSRRLALLELFDSTFSQWLSAKALIATSCISLLAAIGFRSRGRYSRASAASLSMRQLLLLQILAFIALGCWTGMRFLALDSVSGYARSLRKWSAYDWYLTGNEQGEPSTLLRRFSGASPDYELENRLLKSAAAEPWLEELKLEFVVAPDELDFGSFHQSKKLKLLSISFGATTTVNQSTVDQLGKIATLDSLRLDGGSFSATDLSPLAHPPKLYDLTLNGCILPTDALNHFFARSRLATCQLYHLGLVGVEPLRLPKKLRGLTILANSRNGFESENLRDLKDLRHIRLGLPTITEDDLDAISTLPELQIVELNGANDPQSLTHLTRNMKLHHLQFQGSIATDRNREYRQLLMQLAELPELSEIICSSQFLFEGSGPTYFMLNRATSREETEQWNRYRVQRLAAIKELAQIRMELFQSAIDFRRDELKLGKLKIYFNDFQPRSVVSNASIDTFDPRADLDDTVP